MNHTELFAPTFHHYANKNLEAISAMLAEEAHLRDWNMTSRVCRSVITLSQKLELSLPSPTQ